MKRTTMIQLAALVALAVLGAYHGAKAQQSPATPVCSRPALEHPMAPLAGDATGTCEL
ncbi:hypothetical protein [Salipiger sp. PrR002]|uniref:hypothetical protein n=1 Tax=Salipiger sp. PrR002 TaxID=2706489 RepID=UPI0013B62AB8|nr:hypothetical protein [Salipiger sp. PrR002]NDV98107.1 hypothetical protein [Salipiger sp. PrR002]NDW57082.1 hypothetical protein [Salipiger sp. PrR004]